STGPARVLEPLGLRGSRGHLHPFLQVLGGVEVTSTPPYRAEEESRSPRPPYRAEGESRSPPRLPTGLRGSRGHLHASYRGVEVTSTPPYRAEGESRNLGHNKLTDINAEALAHLPDLRELRLDHNELTSIPALGLAASRITTLYL
ncbi:hypothetical protein NHX12_030372, partial [Muraenolepis orangiensis]